MGPLEREERAGWDALSSTSGAAFYREHMADEGFMVFPGMVMDKWRSISTIESVEPWATYELAEPREVVSGDTGLITYTATAQRADGTPYRATMASVYVRRDGRWLLLLHQQSPS